MKKMNEKQMFKILTKLLDRVELESLSNHIVIDDGKDKYQLYNQYSIEKSKGKYTMSKFHTHTTETFSMLRNAVIYTALDKQNRIMDAKRIVELDRLLEDASICIELYGKLSARAKDIDQKTIYLAKLNEDTLKKARIEEELAGFAVKNNRWQEENFKRARK